MNKITGQYTIYSVSDLGRTTLLYKNLNLITNNGLDIICSGDSSRIIYKCVVSSDSSNISENTNQIPSIVATTTDVISREWGAQDTSPYFYWHRTTFEFPPGAANGNLSKIGIMNGSDSIFSVALFKDIEGKATTIQPIENERLRIIYEHRLYMDTGDIVLNNKKLLRGSDKEYTITIRPSLITSSNVAQNLDKGLYIENYQQSGDRPMSAYSGPIGTMSSTPSNYLFYKSGINSKPYSKGSFTKEFYIDFDYSDFNSSVGISSFLFTTSRGCYQIQVTPPLIKNNTQKMRITFPIKVRS